VRVGDDPEAFRDDWRRPYELEALSQARALQQLGALSAGERCGHHHVAVEDRMDHLLLVARFASLARSMASSSVRLPVLAAAS